jgi:DnaJ-class molecular chaperone
MLFQVKPDRDLEREFLDVILRQHVNLPQVTLGYTVSVQTLDEKWITTPLPADSQRGKRFGARA